MGVGAFYGNVAESAKLIRGRYVRSAASVVAFLLSEKVGEKLVSSILDRLTAVDLEAEFWKLRAIEDAPVKHSKTDEEEVPHVGAFTEPKC